MGYGPLSLDIGTFVISSTSTDFVIKLFQNQGKKHNRAAYLRLYTIKYYRRRYDLKPRAR